MSPKFEIFILLPSPFTADSRPRYGVLETSITSEGPRTRLVGQRFSSLSETETWIETASKTLRALNQP